MTLSRGEGGSELDVTMTLIFPVIVWTCPLNFIISAHLTVDLHNSRCSLAVASSSQTYSLALALQSTCMHETADFSEVNAKYLSLA